MNTHSSLRAGVARRDVTPRLGTLLFGYPMPDRRASAVDDSLSVTILALEREGRSALIVALDWCVIDAYGVEVLRGDIASQTGIEGRNILFCASHTHSAPATVSAWGWGERDEEYLEWARPRVVEAAVEAHGNLQPARIGVGVAQSEAGINRREVTPDGSVILGFNPWGARDPDLTVIRFEGEEKDGEAETIASLIHFGAHPTSRGQDPAVSRDWPGVMQDRVETITKAPSLFINGALGDVAPRTNVGGVVGDGARAATEVGLRAATDALRAFASIKEFSDIELSLHHGDVWLPFSPLPSRGEAQEQIEKWKPRQHEWGEAGLEWRHWNAVLREHDERASDEPLREGKTFEQTLLRVGPVVFVPFAGEMFSEIALRLKRLSPFQHTLCVGVCNGSDGYYVTREARARGGYEPWVARAFGAYLLADNIDDVLVQENARLLEELKKAESGA